MDASVCDRPGAAIAIAGSAGNERDQNVISEVRQDCRAENDSPDR